MRSQTVTSGRPRRTASRSFKFLSRNLEVRVEGAEPPPGFTPGTASPPASISQGQKCRQRGTNTAGRRGPAEGHCTALRAMPCRRHVGACYIHLSPKSKTQTSPEHQGDTTSGKLGSIKLLHAPDCWEQSTKRPFRLRT